MSLETELQRTLHGVGQVLAPTTTGPQEVAARGRRRRRTRRGMQLTGAVLVAGLIVLGFSMMRAPVTGPIVADPATPDPVTEADVSIFLCDGRECPEITDRQRADLEARLLADADVARVTYESSQQAWEQFRTRFADQPDLIASVHPDAMPASFRLLLVAGTDPHEVMQRYATAVGVQEVVVGPPAPAAQEPVAVPTHDGAHDDAGFTGQLQLDATGPEQVCPYLVTTQGQRRLLKLPPGFHAVLGPALLLGPGTRLAEGSDVTVAGSVFGTDDAPAAPSSGPLGCPAPDGVLVAGHPSARTATSGSR